MATHAIQSPRKDVDLTPLFSLDVDLTLLFSSLPVADAAPALFSLFPVAAAYAAAPLGASGRALALSFSMSFAPPPRARAPRREPSGRGATRSLSLGVVLAESGARGGATESGAPAVSVVRGMRGDIAEWQRSAPLVFMCRVAEAFFQRHHSFGYHQRQRK